MLKRKDKPEKEKKPFAETTAGKLVGQLTSLIPDVAKEIIPGKVDDFLIDKLIGKADQIEADPAATEEQKALAEKIKLAEIQMRSEAAQHAHDERMAEMAEQTEELKATLADVQSARTRQIDFMKASGGKRDFLHGAVVLFILFMFLASYAVQVFGHKYIDALVVDTIREYRTTINNMMIAVVAFYLGTTRGSRLKDQMLYQATPPK